MNGQFKVGEICVGQNFTMETIRNGMECVITGPLVLCLARDAHTGEVTSAERYTIVWADGVKRACRPHLLRRKQPPADYSAWAGQKVRDLIKPINSEVTA